MSCGAPAITPAPSALGARATYLFTDDTLELKPDLTIFEGDTVRLIVDFKNKLPEGLVGRDDLYQMHAYARHLNAERVLLLYPGGNLPVPVQSHAFAQHHHLSSQR